MTKLMLTWKKSKNKENTSCTPIPIFDKDLNYEQTE